VARPWAGRNSAYHPPESSPTFESIKSVSLSEDGRSLLPLNSYEITWPGFSLEERVQVLGSPCGYLGTRVMLCHLLHRTRR
jgi:hypothetical protein